MRRSKGSADKKTKDDEVEKRVVMGVRFRTLGGVILLDLGGWI